MNFFTFTKSGRTLLLSAAVVVSVLSSGAFAQDSAFVPINVNADAIVWAEHNHATKEFYVEAYATDTLRLPLMKTDGVIYFGAQRQANAPTIVANSGGNITVNLPAQSYKNAEIALYTVNGKRILRNNVFSSNAVNSVSRRNVATGVYLLSVRGADGKAVTARLTHSGGGMNINVAFSGGNLSDSRKMSKKEADAANEWTITVHAKGYDDSVFTTKPVAGTNALLSITLRLTPVTPAHVHNWGDWVLTTPATCEYPGVETSTCKLDESHKQTRTVAQLTGAACNAGDGYESVTIGGLKWMKKNLNIETADSWCYENSPDSCAKYGRLYTWNAAKTACPTGWHLPTRDEWGTLAIAAGGTGTYGALGSAGTVLKSTSGWKTYNGKNGGTDGFGFSALPGGYYDPDNGFVNAGYYGDWWTATAYSNDYAYYRQMDYNYGYVGESNNKDNRLSVRCVAD